MRCEFNLVLSPEAHLQRLLLIFAVGISLLGLTRVTVSL